MSKPWMDVSIKPPDGFIVETKRQSFFFGQAKTGFIEFRMIKGLDRQGRPVPPGLTPFQYVIEIYSHRHGWQPPHRRACRCGRRYCSPAWMTYTQSPKADLKSKLVALFYETFPANTESAHRRAALEYWASL